VPPTIPPTIPAAGATFTSGGQTLFYRDQGSGVPVVLVHGYLADGLNQWYDPGVIDALLAGGKYRVIVPDSRGHGQSAKPAGTGSYGEEMAKDVVALMGHLKVSNAHLVGYSMGSWVAQKVAVARPGLVRALSVGGAGLLGSAEVAGMASLASLLVEYAAGNPLATAALGKILLPVIPLPDKGDAGGPLKDAGFGVGSLALTAAEAAAYTGPLQILVGDKDKLIDSATRLRDSRAKVDYHEIPGAEHLTAFSTAEFKKELRAFLDAH
jgi:pimeloyl-ACP methyl ester carboxylesterase